ncbi:hypothetical protein MPL3356_270098 [Mesorhizobium plurifarium]|uniref:Uncharacterized protein n=1 Tax=Mesorhizobium plurifarium TaxID=69974 RepID=A0A090DPH5_MESPL|nr:hypothetical protein MPL3356_270098 [Mesorhizobium plurifarium]
MSRRSLAPTEVRRQESGLRDGGNLSLNGLSGLTAELSPSRIPPNGFSSAWKAPRCRKRVRRDSVHELRSPIIGSLAQIQRLLSEVRQGLARTADCGVFVLEATRALAARLAEGERPRTQPLHLDPLVADRQALQHRLGDSGQRSLPRRLADTPVRLISGERRHDRHSDV